MLEMENSQVLEDLEIFDAVDVAALEVDFLQRDQLLCSTDECYAEVLLLQLVLREALELGAGETAQLDQLHGDLLGLPLRLLLQLLSQVHRLEMYSVLFGDSLLHLVEELVVVDFWFHYLRFICLNLGRSRGRGRIRARHIAPHTTYIGHKE